MLACPMSMIVTSYSERISVNEAVRPGRSTPVMRIKMSSVFMSILLIDFNSTKIDNLIFKLHISDNKSLPLHRFSGREHLLSGLTNEQSGRKHRVKRSRFCINLNWITW